MLYGPDDRLLHIDFIKAELTNEQVDFFKSKLPVYYSENFGGAFGASNLTIVQEGFKVTFEQWWNRYGVKRNRIRCEKAWNKLSEADQVNAYFKLGPYERHLQLNAWKTKAEPDTYLRSRYWDNDWK